MVSEKVQLELLTRCVSDLTSICEVLLDTPGPNGTRLYYPEGADKLNKCKRRLESIDKAETVEVGMSEEGKAVSGQDSSRDQERT